MTRVVFLVTIVSMMSFIVSGQVFGESRTADQYEQRLRQLNQKQTNTSEENIQEMIKHWQDFVSDCDVAELDIEAQYYIGRIISAKVGESEYLEHIKKSVENYTGDQHHLLYLRMFMTYGQVIAPESERQDVFRKIMTLAGEGVVHPVIGPDSRFYNKKTVEVSLVRGAVWAELQEKTRKIKGANERTAAAQKVIDQLISRPDGKQLSEHVKSWIASDNRRLSPNVPSMGATHKQQLKFSVTVDKNNVVSSRIEGEWVINADLTKVLCGKGTMEVSGSKNLKIAFRTDHSIIKDLPERYYPFLKDKKIYTCGFMTMGGKTYPFYLTHITGNPHILYFRQRNDDPMGDSESFNVMLAVAKEKANDMLFVGGDFNNQPFTAYKRPDQTQDHSDGK